MGSNEKQGNLSSPLCLWSASNKEASICKEVVIWTSGANPMTSLKDWEGGKLGRSWYCEKILTTHHSPFHKPWHSLYRLTTSTGFHACEAWQILWSSFLAAWKKGQTYKSTIMQANCPPAALPGPVNCLQHLCGPGPGRGGRGPLSDFREMWKEVKGDKACCAQKSSHHKEKLYPPEREK